MRPGFEMEEAQVVFKGCEASELQQQIRVFLQEHGPDAEPAGHAELELAQ